MEKPIKPFSYLYEETRAETKEMVNKIQCEKALPWFMVDGIITDVLSEVRGKAISEITQDNKNYMIEMRKYYEKAREENNTNGVDEPDNEYQP